MERARKNNPQVLLILLAAAFAVAAIWAATALAAGGSPAASGDSGGSQPAVAFVQAENDAAPSADDCPDRADGSGGGSGGRPDRPGRTRRTSRPTMRGEPGDRSVIAPASPVDHDPRWWLSSGFSDTGSASLRFRRWIVGLSTPWDRRLIDRVDCGGSGAACW